MKETREQKTKRWNKKKFVGKYLRSKCMRTLYCVCVLFNLRSTNFSLRFLRVFFFLSSLFLFAFLRPVPFCHLLVILSDCPFVRECSLLVVVIWLCLIAHRLTFRDDRWSWTLFSCLTGEWLSIAWICWNVKILTTGCAQKQNYYRLYLATRKYVHGKCNSCEYYTQCRKQQIQRIVGQF